MDTLILATRRSPLALKQAELVASYLKSCLPEKNIEILSMTTTGDKHLQWSLERQGGKGLFTKELEDALLLGKAHIAVHSAKDLPTSLPEGLSIAGFLPREEAFDTFIYNDEMTQPITSIATSSPRRKAQLEKLFPQASFLDIRGNVETRLEKIKKQYAHGTVLASAGLKRLGINHYPGLTFQKLSIEQCVPAPGQAAIALECPEHILNTLSPLLEKTTFKAVSIERAFLKSLGGGCHSAFAAHYIDPFLHIFHHSVGYRKIQLEITDLSEIEAIFQNNLSKWLT